MMKVPQTFLLLAALLVAAVSPAQSQDLISRSVDVMQTLRDFPPLAGYFNTSLQKTPAPAVGKLAEQEFGRPDITRCWLNLDELWDYRTREFDFNFKIGVDKYKDIKEKHRETWDWEQQSPIRYYDYLGAFSATSQHIMLTIRRYERDILDKALPITKADWKMIFKAGLKHYKERYPNIRYVEVGNEYSLKSFMAATADEYYQFYELGYEAVNEVNEELGLAGEDRILVGGPVSTGAISKEINQLAQRFAADQNPAKRLDFVSWHEYTKPVRATAFREREIRDTLRKHRLDDHVPLFITEHDPIHFEADSAGQNQINAAGLVRTLYYASLYSPNMRIFPWALYHDENIQTRFMWFKGDNQLHTPAKDLRMLPIGVSMKLLSMHRGREIEIANPLDASALVIGSRSKGTVLLEAVNYADHPQSVRLTVDRLADALGGGKVLVRKYIIDEQHNNLTTDPTYSGRLEANDTYELTVEEGKTYEFTHGKAGKNAVIAWEISSATSGKF